MLRLYFHQGRIGTQPHGIAYQLNSRPCRSADSIAFLSVTGHSLTQPYDFLLHFWRFDRTENGKLTFAHAYPYGADGAVNILNDSLNAIGDAGSSSSLSLRFRAMAAAITFTDLLPYLEVKDTDVDFTVVGIPMEYGIENYPNPFNPVTHIRFALPKPSHVKIELFNIRGQRIITLLDAQKDASYHTIVFDASRIATGVYFYRMQADKFVDVKKMMLLR